MSRLNMGTLEILLVISTVPNQPYAKISMGLFCYYLQFKYLNSHLPFSSKPAALLMFLIWFIVSLWIKFWNYGYSWWLPSSPHSISCQILSVLPLTCFSCLSPYICISGPADYTSKCWEWWLSLGDFSVFGGLP